MGYPGPDLCPSGPVPRERGERERLSFLDGVRGDGGVVRRDVLDVAVNPAMSLSANVWCRDRFWFIFVRLGPARCRLGVTSEGFSAEVFDLVGE